MPGKKVASGLSLVPARDVDVGVRRELYALTRAPEFAGLPLPEARISALLYQQFDLQERDYRDRFPDADLDTVQRDGEWIGRFYVDRTRNPVRLLDIALLPQWRALGIGRALIESLLKDADKRGHPVVLHVDRTNPAVRLYQRLGFRIMAEEGLWARMTREPGVLRSADIS